MSKNSSDAKRIDPPRKADFMLKPRYTNNVPDVPFDAKFMNCPFVPLSRFVEYKASNIDKDYKHAIICDDDMGLKVDLIDLKKYDEDTTELPFDEKDEFLLEEENNSKLNIKRSAQHSKLVPWMRKTEYISTEFNRFGVTADRQETKLGYNLKKNQQVEDMYRDKQSQINAINKTFEDVKKPVREHYAKKGVKAVSESYIFPDFEHWKYKFTHVQFDGDTITTPLEAETKKQAQESSVIRAMEFDDQKFAAVFVPTIECLTNMMDDLESDRPYDADRKYEFLLSREYTWKADPVPPRDRDVFVMYHRDGRFQYNEIDCNVKMARRRKMLMSRKSKLTLTYRPFNEPEKEELDRRDRELFEQPKSRKQEMLEKQREEEENAAKRTVDDSDNSDSDSDRKTKKSAPAASSSGESSDDEDDDDDDDDDTPTKKKSPATDSDSD